MFLGANTQTLGFVLIGLTPMLSAGLWVLMQQYRIPHKEVISHTVAFFGGVSVYFLADAGSEVLFLVSFYIIMSLFNQFHSEVYDDPEKDPLYLLTYLQKLS